MVEKFNRWV